MTNENRISIIIPCYNEDRFITNTIEKLINLDCGISEIIIVDDNSQDNSVKFIENINDNRIKIISNKKNQGKGYCLKVGIKEAKGDIIVIQDADNEYNPSDIKKLIKPFLTSKADFVIGNRFQSINHRKIGYFYQTLFNKIITFLVNLKTNKNYSDIECGYKLFKKNILDEINLNENSFGIEVELILKLSKKKINIFEVNIDYNARTLEEGKKIKFKDAIRAIYCLIRY